MISDNTFKKMGLLVAMLISFALAISCYFNTYITIGCLIVFWVCASRLAILLIKDDLDRYENKVFREIKNN